MATAAVQPPVATSGTPGATDPTANPDPLHTPYTTDQLTTIAQNQAQREIDAQTQPDQAQITSLQGKETAAGKDIGSMFSGLLPFVSDSAQRVEASNKAALGEEQQIFQAAGQKLNAQAQNQAAEAQQLAQQMGGPVSTGQFTAASDPYLQAFPNEEAGSLLHTLGLGQAGNQEAEQFAGQVFPAMQTEQQAQSKSFFEDQIKTLQDHIDQLNASKSGLVNDKFNTLLGNERQFQLQTAQQQLDKLKAQRDWNATQHTLKNQDANLAIAQSENRQRVASLTGTYKGKPTLTALKLSADIKARAASLGIQSQRLAVQLQHNTETEAIQSQRLGIQQQKNAMAMIDAVTNPGKGTPISQTVKQVIPKTSPQYNGLMLQASLGKLPKDTYYDQKTGQFYQYQKLTMTPSEWAAHGGYSGAAPITDPNRVYNMLTGSGTSPKLAQSLIRANPHLDVPKDWTPGKPVSYGADDLKGMSLDELKGVAENRGWKKGFAGVGRQGLVDFIMTKNPTDGATPGG